MRYYSLKSSPISDNSSTRIFDDSLISAPEDQNVYSAIIQNITYLLSFPQFHLFRAHLASGMLNPLPIYFLIFFITMLFLSFIFNDIKKQPYETPFF